MAGDTNVGAANGGVPAVDNTGIVSWMTQMAGTTLGQASAWCGRAVQSLNNAEGYVVISELALGVILLGWATRATFASKAKHHHGVPPLDLTRAKELRDQELEAKGVSTPSPSEPAAEKSVAPATVVKTRSLARRLLPATVLFAAGFVVIAHAGMTMQKAMEKV